MTQPPLLQLRASEGVVPVRWPLLKWIGNKLRSAPQIISYFPRDYLTYREPFVGSGGVLGTLSPDIAIASDALGPLVALWQTLKDDPSAVSRWYQERYDLMVELGKLPAYEHVKAAFNADPNPADLLFISRACYGGVVRFTGQGRFISTPCGAHTPMRPCLPFGIPSGNRN